jgi:hypothetical protein
MIMETKETQCHPKPLVNATCLLGKKGCYENGKCHYIGSCEHKVLTNADRIRAMTDEELAWELMTWRIETEAKHQGVESSYPNTQATILEWLQQPAEGE